MLTEKAIAGLKAYIDRTIVYARYKINGTVFAAHKSLFVSKS